MISLSRAIEDVIHCASVAERPATLPDFMIEAGINQYGKAFWRDVYKTLSKNLLPNRPYSDLAGNKILPIASRKRVENWAKGRNFTATPMKHPLPEWKLTLRSEIEAIIEESDNMPSDSARKLSSSIRRGLVKMVITEGTPGEVGATVSLIEVMAGELREARAIISLHQENTHLAVETKDMAMKLLQSDSDQAVGQPAPQPQPGARPTVN